MPRCRFIFSYPMLISMSDKWWVINKEKLRISLTLQTRAACVVTSCYKQNTFKDVPKSWYLKDDDSFHKKTSEGGTKTYVLTEQPLYLV